MPKTKYVRFYHKQAFHNIQNLKSRLYRKYMQNEIISLIKYQSKKQFVLRENIP